MNIKNIEAPDLIKKEKKLEIHGDLRIDNYYWLNERENVEVIAYLEAENEYTKNYLAHQENFKTLIFEEIVSRIKKDDSSVPVYDDGYFYYTRYENDNEHPIYCRKKENLEAQEDILLNVNILAKDYEYYDLEGYSVSKNNKMLAYSFDNVSRRQYTIKFKNLETQEILTDEIFITDGSIVWANDNKTIFYVQKEPETLREYKVMSHVLGSSQNEDKLVFEEKDESFSVNVSKSKSDKYILIGCFSTLSTEFLTINADKPESKPQIFSKRKDDFEYEIEHFEDKFYIRTNYKALNFRLMQTFENKTNFKNWIEVLVYNEKILLEDFDIFKNFLVLSERENGLNKLRIINLKTNQEHYLNFEEQCFTAWTTDNPSYNTDFLRFAYSSLTTPLSIFDYNMISQEKILLKQQEIVGNFLTTDYQTERRFATAKDNTQIPISIVYKKGLKFDSSNPTLLYAYGSYGLTVDAYFISDILTLLNRGFVYAIAHVRGGEEMGRNWYEDGKMLNKLNTFTDFIACSEYFINEKFTNTDKLFAEGGSAGGLLMGVISNLRPDLYKGIIAQVPFVDVVTTMLDESIPLTTGEYDEWGDPNEKEFYDYMKSYSPYDNVVAQNYPAMLITTGLHDSQVQYWEPAKWVAKLRDTKTDSNPLLLWTNLEAGHGGASGRFERYKETAMEYIFIFDLLGIKE